MTATDIEYAQEALAAYKKGELSSKWAVHARTGNKSRLAPLDMLTDRYYVLQPGITPSQHIGTEGVEELVAEYNIPAEEIDALPFYRDHPNLV